MTKTGVIKLNEDKSLAMKIATNMTKRRYSNNDDLNNIISVSKDEIETVLSLKPVYNLSSGKSHFELSNIYSVSQNKLTKGKDFQIFIFSSKKKIIIYIK